MTRKNNRNRRQQAPKGRNIEYAKAMQELRRSNASGTHKSVKDYSRKDKSWRNDY